MFKKLVSFQMSVQQLPMQNRLRKAHFVMSASAVIVVDPQSFVGSSICSYPELKGASL